MVEDAAQAQTIQNYLAQNHEDLDQNQSMQRGTQRIGHAGSVRMIVDTADGLVRSPAPGPILVPQIREDVGRGLGRREGHHEDRDHTRGLVDPLRELGPVGPDLHHGPDQGRGAGIERPDTRGPDLPVPDVRTTVVSPGQAAGVRSRAGIDEYLQVVFYL